MKLPNFKRLVYNDFTKDFQPLIEQLSYSINNPIESIISAFSNNISLRDNILCNIKDLDVIVDANGIPLATAALTISNSNPIDGMVVLRAISPTSTNIMPSGGVFLSYTQNGAKVTINKISGLPANQLFSLRIVVFLV